ncbi:MAG: hypothetical protein HDT39_13715 [Lachnospiraceae bacterium]|nr:hypothetical protein [Lachnospiraceae bacterium]
MNLDETITEIDDIIGKSTINISIANIDVIANDILINAVGRYYFNNGFNCSNFKIWLQEVITEYYNEHYPVYSITLGNYILACMVRDDVLIIEEDNELNNLKDWWD